MAPAGRTAPLLEPSNSMSGLRRAVVDHWRQMDRRLRAVLLVAYASFYFLHVFMQGGGMFYFAEVPTFAVSSLHLPLFDVDVGDRLTSTLHINLTARNPNGFKNFDCEDFTVAASSHGTLIGEGLLSGFYHDANETTPLSVSVTSDARKLSPEAASYLKNGSRLLLKIDLESKVKVDTWIMDTVWVRMEVHCKGIKLPVHKGKADPPPYFPDARCKATFRFSIILTVLRQVWENIRDAGDGIGKILLG